MSYTLNILQSLSIIALLLLLYKTIIFFNDCYKLRKFRGPLALPIVGNCYHIDALKFMSFLSKLRKLYGRVFTFFALNRTYLVICDPQVIRRILSDNKTFIKGTDFTEVLAIAFGNGLITSNGERHRHDRSVFMKYFIKSSIYKHMETINSLTSEMINSTALYCNKEINIEHFFAILSLRLFTYIMFGIDYRGKPQREEEIASLVSKGSRIMGNMMLFPTPASAFNPFIGKINDGKKFFWNEIKDFIDEKRVNIANGTDTNDNCVSAMINDNMTDKQMLDHFSTLLSAGHDTTAFYCSYLCYLLGNHQEEQDRLRDEINQVMGNRTIVTENDVADMKYLSKVMQEAIRLYSIVPFMSRLSTEETHIKECGITIPKNVNILLPLFLVNRDPELWENPSQFNPDRFDSKAESFTSAKHGFFPFGYGTRTCIGNTLSILETAVIFTQLLQKYRIKPATGYKMQIQSGISLTTDNGVMVNLSPIN